MSFRFVGTAIAILSTSTATGYYAMSGPTGMPQGANMVVPVAHQTGQMGQMGQMPQMAWNDAAADPRIKAVVKAGDFWRPRIWVGAGATVNPITGAPLSRDEQESGWVDGPDVFAREVVRTVADPVTGVPTTVREPNPEVMVLGPGEKAPSWVRGRDIVLAPGIEVEEPPPPAPAAMSAPPPQAAPPAPAAAAAPQHHHRHKPAAHPAAAPAPAMAAGHPASAMAAAAPAAAAPAPASAMAAAPPAPIKTAAASGGYRIHLESYHNAQLVGPGWSMLQKTNPTVLGTLHASTRAIDIPDKGKFIRLMAGPFANRQAADNACAALHKTHPQQYCHPVAAAS